ncbi:protein ELYS-like [Pluvialis apricaria]
MGGVISGTGTWDSDCLMIDGMVSQLGDQVEKLWQRDEGGTGKYPPASLHALLDLYLLENVEENYKHASTIYLLLDIMHSFPNKTETSVRFFPTAFAVPWGLVKLVQGFWLLDHNDYDNSLALLFHPATIQTISWQHKRVIQSLMCQGEHRQALRYIQMMKPSMSSSSEARLFLTVLLSNRCVVKAWGLLQQQATQLNFEELLKHMYETCQEMGLMEDLLKLPFTDMEQECLERFLQTDAGVQNLEFRLVHHLQRANYTPALQLNQSMKVNLMKERDPRLRERAVVRNSILEQYGKILPRIQRKLAVERAKPYHVPSSVLREVSRPKPLSTVTKQAHAGNVHTRATFVSHVLAKIGEVWAGNEQKPSFSQRDRLPDLLVHPVPSCSPAQAGSWQSPCRASTSFMASSPFGSNMHGSVSQKTFSGASQLNLLETPLVVKKSSNYLSKLHFTIFSSWFRQLLNGNKQRFDIFVICNAEVGSEMIYKMGLVASVYPWKPQAVKRYALPTLWFLLGNRVLPVRSGNVRAVVARFANSLYYLMGARLKEHAARQPHHVVKNLGDVLELNDW